MSDSSAALWAFVGWSLTVGVLGVMFGAVSENHRWEDDLVDRADAVAAIRSRVLAERAEQVATK